MASDIIIKRKEEAVDKIAEKFENSNSVILVNYQGLKVSDITKLRSELHAEGIEFKVLKNNLLRRAAQKVGVDYFDEHLTGANAVAFSEKIVEPAKILNGFVEEFDCFDFKVAMIENKEATVDEVKEIANIPSFDGLLTMLAGGMLSPLKDIAIGLNMLTEGEGNFDFTNE